MVGGIARIFTILSSVVGMRESGRKQRECIKALSRVDGSVSVMLAVKSKQTTGVMLALPHHSILYKTAHWFRMLTSLTFLFVSFARS